MLRLKIAQIILLSILLILSGLTFGNTNKYSPEGFYEVENFQLPNGLNIILKPRGNNKTVAIYLDIGIGTSNFSCEKRETPHFLEHMLFTGTDDKNEIELEEWITSHGGYANATTLMSSTRYEVNIYSGHIKTGLDYLYSIIDKTILSEKNFKLSREILFREMGGKPGKIRSYLFEQNVYKSADYHLLETLGLGCSTLYSADTVYFEDIKTAYEEFYTPVNMTLSIVGKFNPESVKEYIQLTLSKIKAGKAASKKNYTVKELNGPVQVDGNFSPFVSSNSNIGILFKGPEKLDNDIYPLIVLEQYLQTRLYNELRVNRGLAYRPSTSLDILDNFSSLSLHTDIDTENIDTALKIIGNEIYLLKSGKINPGEFQSAKKSILFRYAQGYENNSAIANYYLDNINEFIKNGKYENNEDHILKVKSLDLFRISNKYFIEKNKIIYIDTPTLTYNQLYLLLLILSLVIAGFVYRIIRH